MMLRNGLICRVLRKMIQNHCVIWVFSTFLGQGVKLDYKAADKWLTLAAQNGDLEATRYLRVVKQFY